MTDYFKNYWRNVQKKLRQNLPPHYRMAAAQQIMHQIATHPRFAQANIIALYHAVHGELDSHALWALAEEQGKTCVFPCIMPDKTLEFFPGSPVDPWKNNRFGIPEPPLPQDACIPIAAIDILCVPLVAFDILGHRIGMGAGYYDRTLAKEMPKYCMGIGYDFQRISLITPDNWDIPMQEIITPQHRYRCV